MIGEELRDIGDNRVLDAYISDEDYILRKRKHVKPAMKWKVPANKPKEFKYSADINQSKSPWEMRFSIQIWE